MKIYIASSWRNRHAVEMLTDLLETKGHEVVSFVREGANPDRDGSNLDKWIASDDGEKKFQFDTNGAMESDLVIYIGPSGTDAWAEVGLAWGGEKPIYGLYAKGESSGLMRRMMTRWFDSYRDLLSAVNLKSMVVERGGRPPDLQEDLER